MFTFNVGVEIGQALIVLAAAPLLALLRRHKAALAPRVTSAAALCVVCAGAFWFVQRGLQQI